MVRTTSIIAYNELKGSGKQPKQKDIILDVLKKSVSPLSLQEICNKTGFAINAVSGRVNDLKKANQVVEAEKRKCSVTCKTITPVRALIF
tara:strand:- start:559 stop:828 length:270 start_codon:yes stop_codon:yes gene_type:complete